MAININNDTSNILLMFSGGLDSTGALWQLLQNKENIVHLHHLYLVNKEKRAEAEQRAVKNILLYISRYYQVQYSESYHEYPYYSYLSLRDSGDMILNQKESIKSFINKNQKKSTKKKTLRKKNNHNKTKRH